MGYGLIQSKDNKIEVIECDILKINSIKDAYIKLKTIYEFVIQLIDKHHPDELSIESPFFGKNVQSMLKLGRAQGVAIAAGLSRELPIFEYSPKKIKQSITGNGNASKEQVAGVLGKILFYDFSDNLLDATDAIATAVCHSFQNKSLISDSKCKNWSTFISQNPDRLI